MKVPDRMKQTIRQVGVQTTAGAKKVVSVIKEAHEEQRAVVLCPSCDERQEVVIGGGAERWVRTGATAVFAVTGAGIGVGIGTGVGLASAGVGMPATVPFGVGGATSGAVFGHSVGRLAGKFVHKPTVCEQCGAELINAGTVLDHGFD